MALTHEYMRNATVDDDQKPTRYIVQGRPAKSVNFYYWPRAVYFALATSLLHTEPVTISDRNLYPLAIYANGQRAYHFSEDPSHFLNLNPAASEV